MSVGADWAARCLAVNCKSDGGRRLHVRLLLELEEMADGLRGFIDCGHRSKMVLVPERTVPPTTDRLCWMLANAMRLGGTEKPGFGSGQGHQGHRRQVSPRQPGFGGANALPCTQRAARPTGLYANQPI